MFNIGPVERLLIHVLPDGGDSPFRIFVLLLAGHFRGGNGADGFRDVCALLHQRHSVPLYHELCEHDRLRV